MATDGKTFWPLTLEQINLTDNIMIAHSIFFYTFSLIAIISSIMVIASKNTVHSVFFETVNIIAEIIAINENV